MGGLMRSTVEANRSDMKIDKIIIELITINQIHRLRFLSPFYSPKNFLAQACSVFFAFHFFAILFFFLVNMCVGVCVGV